MCDANSSAPLCNQAAAHYLPTRPLAACAFPSTCDVTVGCCLDAATNKFVCPGACTTPPWVWGVTALLLTGALCCVGGVAAQRWLAKSRGGRVRLGSSAADDAGDDHGGADGDRISR